MLPQQINSLQNTYDDDASLQGYEPDQDSEDEKISIVSNFFYVHHGEN
jgi:hypothetical protein